MANSFQSVLGAQLGVLKNWYAGTIVDQFNNDIPWYNQVEKGREKFAGLQVVRALKVRKNPGIGATSDGGPLPAIGVSTEVQANISARYHYARFGLTGPMLKSAQSDKGAFVNYMTYEMETTMTDFKNDFNRALFWDGSGTLGTVAASAVASTVITATGRTSAEDGSKYLSDAFIGMVIDVINSSGVAEAVGVTILASTGSSTVTLTLSSAVTITAGSTIVRANAYNKEVQGLRTALDGLTTSIYGVDRSVYGQFQGNLVSGQGNQLTLNLMKQGWNVGRQRGGAKYSVVFTDFGTEQMYEKLLVPDRRFVQQKIKGDGTFADKDENFLDYGGIAMMVDKDCTQDIYMLDFKLWKKYVLSELEWADETGSYMIAQVGADSWEIRLRYFGNLFPEKPSAQVRIGSYISP